MNGRVTRSVALVAGLLFFSGSAFAEISSGSSALGNTQGKGTRGGLLNYNKTRFGVPDPADGNKVGAMKIGGSREVNLAQGTTNLGPCEITGKVGSVGGELSAGVGATTDATAGASGPTRSVGGKSPGKGGGGLGSGGLVQCNASVEANLVSVEATCKTAVGTIKPSVKGPGASAGCSCSRGCSAELYWAKAGIEYTTPAVGGCGLKASATVGAEVMAGVAAGAEKVGTVGGKVKLGPVGVTAGINIEEFDLGKTADCVVDGLKKAGEALADVGKKAADIGGKVVSGIADAGKGLAEGVGNFLGGLFGGGKKKAKTGDAGTSIDAGSTTTGGSTSPGTIAQATGTIIYSGVGISVNRFDPAGNSNTVATTNTVDAPPNTSAPAQTNGSGSGAAFIRP